MTTPTDGPAGAELQREDARSSTKERILDAALDLFTEQGFDGTSLREIAEKVGVTKAALYYHFSSKDDILLALHWRLHEIGKGALGRVSGDEPVTLELWSSLLDEVAVEMLAQRKIFLMHERNQAALEKLHRAAHDAEHEDMQSRFQAILADERISLRDRVRMAASFGGLLAGVFMAGDAFSDESGEQLGALLKATMDDILKPTASPSGRGTR